MTNKEATNKEAMMNIIDTHDRYFTIDILVIFTYGSIRIFYLQKKGTKTN